MRSSVAAFVGAMVLTALLTPLVRRGALAVGAVDEPGPRRVHTRRVPRLGGIAIAFGFFLPLLSMLAAKTSAALIFFASPGITLGLIGGALLILSAGLLDDIKGIGAKFKLLMQISAAGAAFAGGMRIDVIQLPGIGVHHLGVLALPATIVWIIGIVNAINLIDGLDGLAAGVTFFACITNFAIASLTGNLFIQLVTAALGGAVIGFLFHNFNPAQIFMGDSGSMFLGFILACAPLLGAGTQKSPTLIAIIVPIVALGLPIMDMLLTIVRRFLERRSIFSADRGHIHHRLLDRGLTHRRAVLLLYMLSVAFTVLALVVYFGRSWQIGAALFSLTALVVGMVRFAGYFGSSLVHAGRGLEDAAAESLRKSVPRTLRRMADAGSPEQLPAILAQLGSEGGLVAIGLSTSKNKRLQYWAWEAPRPEHEGTHEAACVALPITDGRDTLELRFFVDSPTGTVGPQTRILLQLVADGADALLAAPRDGSRPLATPRSERIAQGGG
jgi:UDP-GlcNAc:undecaprenyl-phosphate/decaprenyl-phosphate GlcNAc-1-phosphate transferase